MAGSHFFLQQLAGNVIALFGAEGAQLVQQRLQRLGQGLASVFTLQAVQHGVEHAVPGGVDVLGGRQQGHGMLLGAGHQFSIGFGQLHRGNGFVLGINDLGDKLQIVGNWIAIGHLAQARSALGKQAGSLGQKRAGEAGVIQRLDLAGLEDALHVQSQK